MGQILNSYEYPPHCRKATNLVTVRLFSTIIRFDGYVGLSFRTNEILNSNNFGLVKFQYNGIRATHVPNCE